MEFNFILIGIISALLVSFTMYLVIICYKLFSHKNKIKDIYKQIKGQVNIKHSLLKEYIEINKDDIDEKLYEDIYEKLNHYATVSDVEVLKDHNHAYNYYMKSFNDTLLFNQCNKAEEKINYIKEYYNELVCFYNRFKAQKINSILAKALDFSDEKLY